MKIIITVFLFLSILPSCQKEPDIVLDDTDPVLEEATLLKRYVEVDTTLFLGTDTTFKISFTYDNRNRVIKAQYINYYLAPDIYEGTSEYFYSGNDSLPYKFVDTWEDIGSTY